MDYDEYEDLYDEAYEELDEEMESYEDEEYNYDSTSGRSFNDNLTGNNIPGEASASSTQTGMSFPSMFGFKGDVNVGMVIGIPVISLIITILVFIFVVEKKKAPKSGFIKWLREYLNFRSILISGIIKFVYLFLAVLLTICSFVVMTQGGSDRTLEAILLGLVILVFGNILLRILMELIMIMIGLWKNTSDMRAVMVRDDERPEEKKPKEKEPKEKEPEVKEPEQVEEPEAPEVPQEPQVVEEVKVPEMPQEPQVVEKVAATEMPQESQPVAQQQTS